MSVKWVSISSNNGLLPIRRQAIIRTNASIVLIRPLRTISSEILIKLQNLSFTKMDLKISSAKWRPFCPGGNELRVKSITGIGEMISPLLNNEKVLSGQQTTVDANYLGLWFSGFAGFYSFMSKTNLNMFTMDFSQFSQKISLLCHFKDTDGMYKQANTTMGPCALLFAHTIDCGVVMETKLH